MTNEQYMGLLFSIALNAGLIWFHLISIKNELTEIKKLLKGE